MKQCNKGIMTGKLLFNEEHLYECLQWRRVNCNKAPHMHDELVSHLIKKIQEGEQQNLKCQMIIC